MRQNDTNTFREPLINHSDKELPIRPTRLLLWSSDKSLEIQIQNFNKFKVP